MTEINLNQTINGDNNHQQFAINLHNVSSILAKILPKMVELIANEKPKIAANIKPYDIEEKIKYNNITVCKRFLDNYGIYSIAVDELYNEEERSVPGFKIKLFKYLANIYIKRAISTKSENELMLAIHDEYSSRLNDIEGTCFEEIDTITWIIICHAFINCKIFESPENVD